MTALVEANANHFSVSYRCAITVAVGFARADRLPERSLQALLVDEVTLLSQDVD